MRLSLSVILAFVIVFPVFAQQSADNGHDSWYQGKPIRRIVFDGLTNIKTADLDGITEPYLGRDFNDDVYWEILGRLYALEYFETITPTAVRADQAGN